MFTGPEQLRAEVTVTSLEGMAECLVRLNKPEVAQQKMIEAAELRERHKLGPNMLLAGRVQAESGQRSSRSRADR